MGRYRHSPFLGRPSPGERLRRPVFAGNERQWMGVFCAVMSSTFVIRGTAVASLVVGVDIKTEDFAGCLEVRTQRVTVTVTSTAPRAPHASECLRPTAVGLLQLQGLAPLGLGSEQILPVDMTTILP